MSVHRLTIDDASENDYLAPGRNRPLDCENKWRAIPPNSHLTHTIWATRTNRGTPSFRNQGACGQSRLGTGRAIAVSGMSYLPAISTYCESTPNEEPRLISRSAALISSSLKKQSLRVWIRRYLFSMDPLLATRPFVIAKVEAFKGR